MAINDGGPANAIPGFWYMQQARPIGGPPPDRAVCIQKPVLGMSKLEVFAMHAMNGLFLQQGMIQDKPFTDTASKCDALAEVAFQIAEAMIRAIERRTKGGDPSS